MSLRHAALSLLLVSGLSLPVRGLEAVQVEFLKEDLQLKTLSVHTRSLARDLALQLQDPSFSALLQGRLGEDKASAMLGELLASNDTSDMKALRAKVLGLDQRILKAKGTSGYSDALLEVRMVNASATLDWERVLVAYVPSGDEKSWSHVEAFDASGAAYHLDPHQHPDRPVLVVGLNGREDLRSGLAFMNHKLAEAGLQPRIPEMAATATTVQGTKLTWAYLRDDKEPWVKGDAEIFAFTSGVNPFEDKPSIQVVDMPWLNTDKKNYYPNQPILFWNNYRFSAANIQLYEHDDNTNYQQILSAVLKAAGAALVATGYGVSYGWIPVLADAIITAMPTAWYVDDDDYVDTFYLIEKNRSYNNLTGAAGNASISLAPFTLTSN